MNDPNDLLIISSTEPPQTPRTVYPAPGMEYPFSIGDIAYATARLLGRDWCAEAGHWGINAWRCRSRGCLVKLCMTTYDTAGVQRAERQGHQRSRRGNPSFGT